MYVYGRESVEIQTPKHCNLIADRSGACVIAQQYSSACCVSLSFHFHKEKFDVFLKNVVL
jgi:hypothetical protein